MFAHIGGRYADIKMAHDARIERSVEVHSDWGTFEWLVHDAFEQGYRVGILANSDGHKGRHGASHPGASLFGAYGGLSCLLATGLSRQELADALRQRHHYATTGCRMVLDTRATFAADAELYADDPNLGATTSKKVNERDDGRHRALRRTRSHIQRRRARIGADRAHRNPQSPGDAGDVSPVCAKTARPAHPRDLGRFRIPRPRPPDRVGRRLHAHRQQLRESSHHQFLESRQETRAARTRPTEMGRR